MSEDKAVSDEENFEAERGGDARDGALVEIHIDEESLNNVESLAKIEGYVTAPGRTTDTIFHCIARWRRHSYTVYLRFTSEAQSPAAQLKLSGLSEGANRSPTKEIKKRGTKYFQVAAVDDATRNQVIAFLGPGPNPSP